MEEKNQLRSSNGSLSLEIQQLIAKIAATESAKQREIDELKFTLTSQTNANSEKEKRELAQKYENEVSRMEYEIRRLKEINETKNDEIEGLQRELKRVNGYLEEEKAKQEHYQTLQNNLKEYEQRFGIFSHEIERLNAVLRTKANEAETFASQNRTVSEELARKNQEIERLLDEGRRKDSRLAELSSTISEYQLKIRQLSENSEYLAKYEEKIGLLSRELERLNTVLREKSNENAELRETLARMEYEQRKIELVNRENEDLRKSINASNETIARYENKIALLSQEIERLNENLRLKVNENSNSEIKTRNLLQEIEALKRRNNEYEITITQQWETKWTRVTQENEELRRRLNELAEVNRKVAEYENKIALLSQEIERLNGNLRNKVDENGQLNSKAQALTQEIDVLKRRNNEYEITITQQWETKWTRITQENEELRRRLNELGEVNRKVAEYENRIALLSQELERLNGNLRSKMNENDELSNSNYKLTQEIDGLKRRNNEYEVTVTREWESKVSRYNYEIEDLKGQLNRLSQDNEELRRRLSELAEVNRKVAEYENRIALLSQELERLNGNLRVKMDEIAQLNNQNHALTQ